MYGPDETQKMIVLWTIFFGWWLTLAGGLALYVGLSTPRELGEAVGWVVTGLFFVAIGLGPFIWMRWRR